MHTENNEINSSSNSFITDYLIAHSRKSNSIVWMSADILIEVASMKKVYKCDFGPKIFICPDLTAGENVSNIGKTFSTEILKKNFHHCLDGLVIMGGKLPSCYIFVIQISEDQYRALAFINGRVGHIFYLNTSDDKKMDAYDKQIIKTIANELRTYYLHNSLNLHEITKEKLIEKMPNDYDTTVCAFLDYFLLGSDTKFTESSLCRFLKTRMMNSKLTRNCQIDFVKKYSEFKSVDSVHNATVIVKPQDAPNKRIRLNSGHSAVANSNPFVNEVVYDFSPIPTPSLGPRSSVNNNLNSLNTISAIKSDWGKPNETSHISSSENKPIRPVIGAIDVDNLNKASDRTPIPTAAQTQSQQNIEKSSPVVETKFIMVDKKDYYSMILDNLNLRMALLANQFELFKNPIYRIPLEEMVRTPAVVQTIIKKIDEIIENFLRMLQYPKEIIPSQMNASFASLANLPINIYDRSLLNLPENIYSTIQTLWCDGKHIDFFVKGVTKNKDFKHKGDKILYTLSYLKFHYNELFRQSFLIESPCLAQASENSRSTTETLQTAVNECSAQSPSTK